MNSYQISYMVIVHLFSFIMVTRVRNICQTTLSPADQVAEIRPSCLKLDFLNSQNALTIMKMVERNVHP